MLAATFVVAATMAASALAHTPAGVHRRELVYQLRQMAERAEIYPGSGTVPAAYVQPACSAVYDTPQSPGSSICVACGPGRALVGGVAGKCQIADPNPPFGISDPLTTTETVAKPITWAAPVSGPQGTNAMNQYTCAVICEQDPVCTAFAYVPGSTGQCYKIAGDGVYDSPEPQSFFTPDTTTRMVKRAAGQTGSFNSGIIVGGDVSVAPTDPTVGCLPALGDVLNTNLSCTCGPSRVNDSTSTCKPALLPSGGARMARKIKRDVYGGVPW